MAEKKQAPHVEQALAEAAGATNEEQVKAAQKRLDATGYKAAAKERAAAADAGQVDGNGDDKRRRPPQGRQAPAKQTS